MDDFGELEKYMAALLSRTSAANVAKGAKAAGKKLRSINARRIAANIAPSGAKFAPRKPKKDFEPENRAKFLYPAHGGGAPRLVILSAWTQRGNTITGYDKERKSERNFKKDKIIKWIPNYRPKDDDISATPITSKIRAKAGGIARRNGKMFQKAKSARHLKTKGNAKGFEVGFGVNTSWVLGTHHYGGFARMGRKSTIRARYESRPLLGINPDDAAEIMDAAVQIISI